MVPYRVDIKDLQRQLIINFYIGQELKQILYLITRDKYFYTNFFKQVFFWDNLYIADQNDYSLVFWDHIHVVRCKYSVFYLFPEHLSKALYLMFTTLDNNKKPRKNLHLPNIDDLSSI